MRNILILTFFALLIFGCSVADYESDLFKSPSENYWIKATVNKTVKNAEDYADVVIHVYDSKDAEIEKINSNAGDFSKWAIGWTEFGDTIVLFSSDIGNKAWSLIDHDLQQISVNKKLDKRATELKIKKYN
jgi:hypothetical protein